MYLWLLHFSNASLRYSHSAVLFFEKTAIWSTQGKRSHLIGKCDSKCKKHQCFLTCRRPPHNFGQVGLLWPDFTGWMSALLSLPNRLEYIVELWGERKRDSCSKRPTYRNTKYLSEQWKYHMQKGNELTYFVIFVLIFSPVQLSLKQSSSVINISTKHFEDVFFLLVVSHLRCLLKKIFVFA